RGNRHLRHRGGHPAGGAGAGLRALLHHQARGLGARAPDRPPRGREPWREPLAREPPGRGHHRARAASRGGGAVVTPKARILVVDDEQSMREFLDIFFRGEGYEVVTAPSVDSALVAIESDDFDVVISDIQMPDRTGLELLHAVKDSAPQTVVIMITAFATAETAITAMKQGA